jgi:hypothetical protein
MPGSWCEKMAPSHAKRDRTLDWFERITGFGEEEYASTQARLHVDGNALVNEVTG